MSFPLSPSPPNTTTRIYRILERGIEVTMDVEVQVAFDESDPSGYNVIGEIPGE